MAKKKPKKVVETIKRFHEDEEGWAMNLSNHLTPKQAPETLGVDPSQTARLMRDGKLKGIKLGHDWLVFAPSLERYLNENQLEGDRQEVHPNSKKQIERAMYLSNPLDFISG